ncbi:Mitochondrial import inner membrane translocase subunit Tim21 [Varanus komodoensis]|uniref:Mitochondrial import inner membrane translocase subunit Tim21 n=1 Tax=Varanus komodoensis TaxID=61221 RepID=A0A8D2LSP7_VARKO|nr:mitochondrial import inner membrane translocase subunit Tim21 [Varanus komodoensis]KAF7245223.1 Mitochondrial import inner membrane translocase subunit Tim21 [Varanus komodoensis]
MLSFFLRGIHCSDKLLGSSVQRSLSLPRKALLRTWARFGLGQGHALRPGAVREVESVKRNLWTPQGALRAGKPENSAQVSVQRSPKGGASLSAAQKVKEAGRDFTYLIIVVVGIGVTGGLFYVIFKELFSSSSPSKIYGDALEKCRAHPEVIGVFGEPIKGYGEATRRGRRQLVSHIEYVKDGLKYMRLKFYIEGLEKGKQGTVHLEVKENPESGKYEYRYIFVDLDVYPRRTIIIEDNR